MKYIYKQTRYINARTKITIICPIHGQFQQRASAHLAGQGCPRCALKSIKRHNNNHTIENFIKTARKKHSHKYDYSKTTYKKQKDKITIICPIHGQFQQRASAHLAGQGCPQCGKTPTLTTTQFITKSKIIHKETYDYTETEYINTHTPVIIICKIHGKFKQTPISHLSGHGCQKCGLEKDRLTPLSNTTEFVAKANAKHKNQYEYDETDYRHSKEKVIIICKEHGKFTQKPNYHLCGNGCPKCAGTKLQQEVYEFIKQHTRTEFNSRTIIPPLELDIYLPDFKIGIEVNGLYWHSYSEPETPQQKRRHLQKLEACQNKGIILIQIMENEWKQKQQIIKSMILNKLGKSKRIYARNCTICYPNPKEYHEFMDRNHLQGSRNASVILALKNQESTVMMMSLHRHPKYQWEITRIATEIGYIVIGGLSKLLSKFIKHHKPSSILTYANRRYSDGNAYKIIGFKVIKTTKPNYWYIKRERTYSRQQFQKHKQPTRLPKFDKNMTESQNMFNNGFRRIWDCGNLKLLLFLHLG